MHIRVREAHAHAVQVESVESQLGFRGILVAKLGV